jgi:hypothetical protein
MRVQALIAGLLTAALGGGAAVHGQEAPKVPAGQLVREVVYNELNDHARHGYWRYWVERRTQSGTRLEQQVETTQGPLTRLSESNGRPLNAGEQQQEQARLVRLVNSPQEQQRQLEQYNEDEQRIGRILALLPDAFLYEYDGFKDDTWHLRFRPNPAFPTHSIEARVFHAMSGDLWVNARSKRLTRLEGRVADNVDFGFGILGRLYKGGWFRLVRTQVSPTDWKTAELEVHMSIRALLVKTFAKETSEARRGFQSVPSGMNLTQAMHLLDATENALPVTASMPRPPVLSATSQHSAAGP